MRGGGTRLRWSLPPPLTPTLSPLKTMGRGRLFLYWSSQTSVSCWPVKWLGVSSQPLTLALLTTMR